jgi:hypothetical protein
LSALLHDAQRSNSKPRCCRTSIRRLCCSWLRSLPLANLSPSVCKLAVTLHHITIVRKTKNSCAISPPVMCVVLYRTSRHRGTRNFAPLLKFKSRLPPLRSLPPRISQPPFYQLIFFAHRLFLFLVHALVRSFAVLISHWSKQASRPQNLALRCGHVGQPRLMTRSRCGYWNLWIFSTRCFEANKNESSPELPEFDPLFSRSTLPDAFCFRVYKQGKTWSKRTTL